MEVAHTVQVDDVRIERPRAGAAVVVLLGEHDISTSPGLARILSSLLDENELVVTDVSEVEFLDSSVINVLIEADRAASAQERSFRLQVGTEAVVHRVLEITGVLQLLDCASTREQALNGRSDSS